MFDLSLPIHSTTCPARFAPVFAIGDADPNHPFALTLSHRTPADLCRAGPPHWFSRVSRRWPRPCRARSIMPRGWPRMPRPSFWRSLIATSACSGRGRQRRGRRLVPPGNERNRGAGRGDRSEPASRAGEPRCRLGRADLASGCGTVPIFWRRGSSIRSGAPLPPGRCRSRRDPERQRRAGGIWSFAGGE
jgi:hypothetical protein